MTKLFQHIKAKCKGMLRYRIRRIITDVRYLNTVLTAIRKIHVVIACRKFADQLYILCPLQGLFR